MPEGVILLDRMYFEKPEWLNQAREGGFTRGAAWLDMLALCNQTATQASVRGIQIPLERGECARSKLGLASRWGRSWSWITATLASWEKDGRIQVRKSDNEMTVIFITNFDAWQTGMASQLGPNGDQNGSSSGPNRDREGEGEGKDREPRGDREGGGAAARVGWAEVASDEEMIGFGATWGGEMSSGTPKMEADWVLEFVKKMAGRNSPPWAWQRCMVASWRAEWRKWGTPAGLPGRKPMGSPAAGEAIWKKLRSMDERMAETRDAMTGKEFTDPETFERLEKELDTMMKQRKEMAETT